MNCAGLIKDDLANGPGVRISLFVAGCGRKCRNCYNKDMQSFDYGQPFTNETTNEILEYVSQSHCSGLSILGGEPLDQDSNGLIGLIELAQEVHKLGKNVWLWTGYTWEEIFNYRVARGNNKTSCHIKNTIRCALLNMVDVVVDGPFIEEQKDLSLRWRGSANQRVIDVQNTLESYTKYNEVTLLDGET